MSSNDERKLRDWLAGQALAGMLANQERLKIIAKHDDPRPPERRNVSQVIGPRAERLTCIGPDLMSWTI